MRLSAPRIAITAAVIGTAAATTSVAFAATGPAQTTVTKAGAPTAASGLDTYTDGEIAASATEKYWTKERMASAKPVPLPKTVTAAAASVAVADAPLQEVPAAPVGDTVATSGGVSTSAVTNTKQWPYLKTGIARTTGRIYFVKGGDNYVCSGTVVNAPNRRTVWTAGHCLHGGGPGGTWHKNVMFAPGYRDGRFPGGRWTARFRVAGTAWTKNRNLNYRYAHDLAAFTVWDWKGQRIQGRTGGQGISWGYKSRNYFMRAFGYPVVYLPSGKRTQGHRLYYCTGNTRGIRFHSQAPTSLQLPCTMGGGASGGSWLYGMNSKGWGRVAGVNSTHSTRDNRMFSPYQGRLAADIYNWIKTK
ncbi:trypsin-like serine peptidase [Thermomonospora umbrina]|uniref:V8-like Glu-specific endopeptidase n=1 Tax=Thermomonospora umbrina TaxID=111806 RepID=A0A3D9SSR1_9ACTN|nr:hypothetical protein [Thermomonospora umbrina]REE96005.1 hypothetical protein DFJ69_1425 [Thermomonospora umbrina]